MSCRIDPPDAEASRITTVAPLPAPLAWIEGAIAELRSAGLERPHRVRAGRQGCLVDLDGRTLLNFGSNDYLGYAGDVRLTKAASKGSCAEGFGAGASPLVSGQSRAHEALEQALAGLLAVEDALIFPSGFAANTATIAALVGRHAGRDSARALIGAQWAERIDSQIQRRGLWAVVGQRFVPGVSDALASYTFGAFGLPLWQMAIGAAIGSVPRAFVYTALGASISDLNSPLAYVAIGIWCLTAIIGAFAAHRGFRSWRARDR